MKAKYSFKSCTVSELIALHSAGVVDKEVVKGIIDAIQLSTATEILMLLEEKIITLDEAKAMFC